MKRRLLLLIMIVSAACTAEVSAQALKTSYFMEGAVSRMQLNPALNPYRGYVNLPGIGAFGLNFSSNALSVSDVIYRNGEDRVVPFWDSSVNAEQLFSSLKGDNRLSLNNSVALLGFGDNTRKGHFWCFDINMRTQLDVSLPLGAFEMIKSRDGLGSYSMENLSVATASYLEGGFGYAFGLLQNRLRIGVKAKFLAGIMRARMNFDRIEATRGDMEWHLSTSGSIDIPAFMLNGMEDEGIEMPMNRITADDIGFNRDMLKLPLGYGFAIDFGASFEPVRHLTISAALTDLGVMFWNSENMFHGVSNTDYTATANDSGGPDIEELFAFDRQEPLSYNDRLWSSFNVGVEYDFPRLPFSIGVLSTNMWRHKQMVSEVTGSFNLKPCHWFGLTMSCTASRSGFRPGAALNLYPTGLNLFIGTDNLLFKTIKDARNDITTVTGRAADIYVGLSISLGRGKLKYSI